MTTLRPTTLLWRRTRTALLATSIAIGSVMAPTGASTLADSGSAASADGTSGASTFVWEGSSLSDATAIVAAGGQNLNLRAEPDGDADVVAKIPHGAVVALRIDETDTVLDAASGTRWWPVEYNGVDGWASGHNLVDGTGLEPGDVPFEFPGGSLADAEARVRAEAGLRLRADPDVDAKVLATIPNGTVVELRIDETDTVLGPDGVTRWWPVTFNGHEGWVSGYYLVDPDAPATTTAAAVTKDVPDTAVAAPTEQFEWDGGALEGATAIAAGFGENVNVRAEATEASEIVAKVPDGTIINLRIDRVDTVIGPDGETRWWPVVVDGVEGWVSGFYLTDGTQATVSSDIFPVGSIAMVQTPTGEGLRLRASAGMDAEQIASLPDRSQVTILSGSVSQENSTNGWFQVRAESGLTGYVDGDLLILLATPVAEPATEGRAPATVDEAATESESDGTDASVPSPTATETPVTPVTRTTDEEAGDERSPQRQETPTAAAADDDERADQPTPTPAEEIRETPPPPAQAPTQSASSQFIVPVAGATRTQDFGCSSLGFYPYNPDWGCGVHDGIDFAAPAYTPIVAAAAGTVVTAGWCDCGLGYYVEIDHGNGVHTVYGHMAAQPPVSVGQRVSQGETIGSVGSSGLSTGPHVHFMVQVNGVTQDPNRYLS
ncbi:MAG TPA: SH3 domain-containing protein [Thermomicrobiales bacterium]|nr:SH3 domain-containing protein [Thermomicrobiales bacterium]